MRRTLTLATLTVIVATATAAFAHEGRDHFLGTVTRAEKGRIEIKGTDGKSVAFVTTSATVYTKGNEPAGISDVKLGARIEIEAMKGKEGLEAMEVKIGTAEAKYTCPMHPEVEQSKPGTCPKCGMNLEKKG